MINITAGRCARSLLLAATLTIGMTAAQAEPEIQVNAQGGVTRTMAVPINDLNLASPSAHRIIHGRIARAARKVCDYSSMHGLKQPIAYQRCEENALAGAAQQLAPLQMTAQKDAGRSSARTLN
jgi:UrcA family protein